MDKTYRISANIGSDQTINLHMKNDIDSYEILTMSINQNDMYRLQKSNYGVIVGRILANDAFGVPNAKVSVFIPLTNEDKQRTDLTSIYGFSSISYMPPNNIRYNLLPGKSNDECYQVVGTFPTKRMILDNDSMLEVYDTYYKYTTTTNQSGDYMIFGVPVGERELHVDVDLSDIGVLSQRPRDFISKGYNINQFQNASQFKSGKSLDNLAQIFSQNETVNVSPFWGSSDYSDIAITRKDINLQYKFETSCVFLGSIITDNVNNSINHNCKVDEMLGDASQLNTCAGRIEMIQKNIYGGIEEKTIEGNELINSDGVWCYQIPMNLDYVAMDEYGNIVPSNDPSKGIATRASVRFRFTLDDTNDDAMTKHKARYLVPCNPDLYERTTVPFIAISATTSGDCIDFNDYYEFGSKTPDNCFRDLFWNKVYTVKSYIPRIQRGTTNNRTSECIGIKNVNKLDTETINPFPYNKIRPQAQLWSSFVQGILRNNTGVIDKIKDLWSRRFISSSSDIYDADETYSELAAASNRIGLSFFNDWINGCLYFPMWFWKVKQKKKYRKWQSPYSSEYCQCKNDGRSTTLYLMDTTPLEYKDDKFGIDLADGDENFAVKNALSGFTSNLKINDGLIYPKTNSDETVVYYYSFGVKDSSGGFKDINSGETGNEEGFYETYEDGEKVYYRRYKRLFSTDIVLLGSLVENDINGIPQISDIPRTTCTIPPMLAVKDDSSAQITSNHIDSSGMNWGMKWGTEWTKEQKESYFGYKYDTGLFFGLYGSGNTAWTVCTLQKSYVNVERMCELGVSPDERYTFSTPSAFLFVQPDGFITNTDIFDDDARAKFATLNANKLVATIRDKNTGYKFYNFSYLYPSAFDGRLGPSIERYGEGFTPPIIANDYSNFDYSFFRLGGFTKEDLGTKTNLDEYNKTFIKHFRRGSSEGEKNANRDAFYEKFGRGRHFYCIITGDNKKYVFPLYENSFYFYFGLNNGKTAIDTFREKFFAGCTKNNDNKSV